MGLTLLLFFLATLALTSAGMVGYWLFRKRAFLLGKQREKGTTGIEWAEPAALLKAADPLSTISVWARLLERVDYADVMKRRMREAGVNWSVGRLTASMLLCGAISSLFLFRLIGTSAFVTAAGALIGAMLPYGYVLRLRRKRFARLEAQFSDALDSLARAMRAGNPLLASLEIVASETPEPLAGELRLLVEGRRFGRSWEEAVDNLVGRAPLVEVSIFAAAVKLQNRTGGKLSEVLGRLAETLRDSESLRTEVRSIAAHGKATGTILTVLPLLIAVLMASVNPSYFDVFWSHPVGRDLVAAGVMSLIAAHLLIRKLVDIKL